MTPEQQALVGKRIRQERERSRLTQRELARLVELDYTTVSAHENGRGVTEESIKKYASVFKIDSYTLLVECPT